MLEYLETEDVWETIRNCPQAIALYGMGDGAEKILNVMERYGRTPDVIFASDQFVRGHSFRGKKVLKYSDVCERLKDFTVIMAFGIHDAPMLEYIRQMNAQHTVLAPDVPIAGDGLFTREFIASHRKEFSYVYNNLADDRSKEVYINIINYKISGKVDYLYKSFDEKSVVYDEILCLSAKESIVDLGAYDGDTIREFLHASGGQYKHITAVEADEKNFKKLVKNTQGMEHLDLLNLGVWKEKGVLSFDKKAGRNSRIGGIGVQIPVDSVDHFIQHPVTFLKMDIEGAELDALEGAKKTIQQYRPKLYVCAYHRNEDLYALPLKIWELCPDYKLYFRHSPYIPAWECNFYGVADRGSR